jgi:hypothetical protein
MKTEPKKREPTPSTDDVLRRMLGTPPAPFTPKKTVRAKPKKRTK